MFVDACLVIDFVREFSVVSPTVAANLLTQKLGKKVGRKGFLLLFYCLFTKQLSRYYHVFWTPTAPLVTVFVPLSIASDCFK